MALVPSALAKKATQYAPPEPDIRVMKQEPDMIIVEPNMMIIMMIMKQGHDDHEARMIPGI